MKRDHIFLVILISVLAACSKKSGANPDIIPSNLIITTNVSNDNSGNVSFNAKADNAVLYNFDFGNGSSQVSTTGILDYKYGSSGLYTVTVVAKSSNGRTVSKIVLINVTVILSLVWADEFEVPGMPDAAKWGYDLGTGSSGWGNNELEYYTSRPENVQVSGGLLRITAIKESYNGSAYTSSRMLSRGKFSFKYGKIEARAKLPTGIGTWPAIWMLGDNIGSAGWPGCGEIDIMEHKGSSLNKIYGTLHYPGHSGGNGDGGTVTIANAATAFHRYTVEWNEATIKFLVDDSPFYVFSNSGNLPFNQNFFIILNLAMGGNFGGAVDPAFTSASLEVDYIRIYQ